MAARLGLRSGGCVMVVVIAVAALFFMAEAVDYQVGDSQGWQPPSSDSTFYSTWATGKIFAVGDTLTFNFATGVHDVATGTKADYDGCNVGAANSVMTTGPTTVTLSSAGMQYFFCTLSNHCSRGQKLAVNVGGGGGGGGGSSGSPPAPSSSSGDSPPAAGGSPPADRGSESPPSTGTPNSGESLAASFVLILISLAVGAVVWF